MTESQEAKEAMDRIARTPDGFVLYRYLQKELCSICPENIQGALRRHEGRRSLARDLMTLMGEGIDASVRRDGNEQPVILQRDGGSNQPRRRQSVRDYVASLPSWSDDAIAADKPAAGAEPA